MVSTSETYAINLNNVSIILGEKEIISSLSLDIKNGEKIALIGPSGAGKTTLLNMLSNSLEPTSGDIKTNGKYNFEYKNNKEFAKIIGMIHQQFDLVDQLLVINNVLAGKLNQWGFFNSLISLIYPSDKHIAVDALKKVGISDKLYEKTSNLSGGEKQRTAMARLLVQNPSIILADEPVSSLDPARAKDILSLLISITDDSNKTLITSIHSTEFAKKYFDRVIGLRYGEVFFDKPSCDVTRNDLDKLYHIKRDSPYE